MGQSTRRLSGLPIDLHGNVNPGHPFDRGARFELLIECMASNREVMARSGFMEVESSPLALQARGPETAFWEMTDETGELKKLLLEVSRRGRFSHRPGDPDFSWWSKAVL
jgi:hypothetical protein